MRQPQIVRTTLGDLIAAVTEEVTAVIGDSSGTFTARQKIIGDGGTETHLYESILDLSSEIAVIAILKGAVGIIFYDLDYRRR